MQPARLIVPVLLAAALLAAACKAKPSPSATSSSAAAVPKGTLTPDVRTVQAFMNDPALAKGELAGQRVRVHGYVLPMSPTKTAITADPAQSMPFVACLAPSPSGLSPHAHVIAEGVVGPTGQLVDCTLSSL